MQARWSWRSSSIVYSQEQKKSFQKYSLVSKQTEVWLIFSTSMYSVRNTANTKYSQHKHNLEICHAFIDIKKAFDWVWHEGLWDTMYLFGFDDKLITLMCQLYKQASSMVMFQGAVSDWLHPKVGVCQGCLLSPTLFNSFIEWIMGEVLDSASNTVSIGSRNISNVRYANDIYIVAGCDTKLAKLVLSLNSVSRKYGMKINTKEMTVMTNSKKWLPKYAESWWIWAGISQPFQISLSHFLWCWFKARDSSKNCTNSCSNAIPKISKERQKNQYKDKAEVGTNYGKIHFPICLWDLDINSWTLSRESKQLRCIGCRLYLAYHIQTMCPTLRAENILRERVTMNICCQ